MNTIARVISFFIIVFVGSAVANDGVQHFKLGDDSLTIPQRYLQDADRVPWWLRWLRGLDSGSRELLLTVDASEVAASIPGFKPTDGRYSDNIRVRLSVLTTEEQERYLDPNQLADAWTSTGSYREAVIEPDPGTQLTRLYRKVEYPVSWELLKVRPTGPLPSDLYASWVGHCIRSRSPLTPSGSLALCKSHVIVGDIGVNFTVSEQNIYQVDALRAYLVSLVTRWLQPAAG